MHKNVKSITVLMPTFNCARYLASSVKSVLNQTYTEFEFLIIDDGSTDNTEEVVYGFKDSRLIYRKTANNGTAAALNYGLKLASGDWIARIDADDLNSPFRLEKQVAFIENNPEYDVISSWSVYFKDPGSIIFLLKSPVEHQDIYEMFDLHNPINQSSAMFRKKIVKKEAYDEEFLFFEDFELFRSIRDKVKFYNLPEYLSFIRLRSSSKSGTFHQSQSGGKNIYDVIFNDAFKNLLNAKSKGEHFYWATTIAWINFFYGNRKQSRNYFMRSLSLKNTLAYFATYLPESYFRKFIGFRARYRLQSLFADKKKLKKELKNLLI